MFDQDHGLIKTINILTANLHQNNSNDVFMFHLRRAEHRELGPTVLNSLLCLHRRKTMRVCRSNTRSLGMFTVRCVSAMRRVFFTVNPSSALGLSSDEFLMTHSTS